MEYGVDFSNDKIKEILLNNLHYKIADEGDEWYLLQNGESEKDFVNKVKAIIVSLKNNTPLNISRYNDFLMREEQKECVDKTVEAFKTCNSFLWNCKMRFGKTFTAYQLIKQLNIKNSLILTWKVAVEGSWQEDLESHIDFKDYSFINKEHLNNIDKNKNNVVFLSIPLLLANKTKYAELEEDDENSEDKEISEENIQKFKEKIKSP